MKRFIVVCAAAVLLCGCSAHDKVRNIIRDQEFADYQKELDNLEKDYLHKRMSYADYLEKKQQVEENYEQQISSRRDAIENIKPAPATGEMAP